MIRILKYGEVAAEDIFARAVPEVNVEGDIKITYQNNIWSLGSGSYTLPELELVHGENALQLEGTGAITFEWQEGDL
jgi:hypothetical protein